MDHIRFLFNNYGANDYIGEPVNQREHALQCAHFARESRPKDSEFVVAALLHDIGHLLGLWITDDKRYRQDSRSRNSVETEKISGDSLDKFSVRTPGRKLAETSSETQTFLEDVMGIKDGSVFTDLSVDTMGDVGISGHENLALEFCTRIGLPSRVGILAMLHVSAKKYLCCVDPHYYEQLSDASKITLKFQGGPMGNVERRQFEDKYGLETVQDAVALRRMDEKAKDPDLHVEDLETYAPLVKTLLENARLKNVFRKERDS